MQWPNLPDGENKPAWAGLFGAVSLAYLFWDPYQNGASFLEWFWTSLAFATFLILITVGLIYWSRRVVILRVGLAMAATAVIFSAYRPGGIFLFVWVAGFAPLAVGGRIGGSAAIIAGLVLVILGEWALFWPPALTPYVIAGEAILVGGAITLILRQQIGVKEILRTAERERIARDLHDVLGHTLSVITLKSELASRLLEHDPARAKSEIEAIERISRDALSEVREAIAGYRAGDLAGELDRAKTTLETAGIAVERRGEAFRMPIAQEQVLVLVLREAITNILRHAHAKHCRITLQQSDVAYRLEVHDDGRGGIHREGLGMRGIRERVAAIGGNVSWNVGPGTELAIAIPAASHAPREGG
jgi:two-component system sensor histidine kinase DesK